MTYQLSRLTLSGFNQQTRSEFHVMTQFEILFTRDVLILF